MRQLNLWFLKREKEKKSLLVSSSNYAEDLPFIIISILHPWLGFFTSLSCLKKRQILSLYACILYCPLVHWHHGSRHPTLFTRDSLVAFKIQHKRIHIQHYSFLLSLAFKPPVQFIQAPMKSVKSWMNWENELKWMVWWSAQECCWVMHHTR